MSGTLQWGRSVFEASKVVTYPTLVLDMGLFRARRTFVGVASDGAFVGCALDPSGSSSEPAVGGQRGAGSGGASAGSAASLAGAAGATVRAGSANGGGASGGAPTSAGAAGSVSDAGGAGGTTSGTSGRRGSGGRGGIGGASGAGATGQSGAGGALGDVSASTTGAVGTFFCADHTHFDTTGATQIAGLVAGALKSQNIPLAKYLL